MGTWGLRGGQTGGVTTLLVYDYDNGAQARQLTVAPGGRPDISGKHPVKISNIRFVGSSGLDYISGAGTYDSSSNFNFTVTAGNNGRRQGAAARDVKVSIRGSSSGDNRIRTYTAGGSNSSETASYYSNFTGSFDFEFVNTPPTSISVSRNGTSVTVSAAGAGGSHAGGPSSYTIQYNDNAGSGWVGNSTSPATYNFVSGRTYSFRAWANNGVGSSQIFTSGSVYIPRVPSSPNTVLATTSTTRSGAINISWRRPASDVAILEYHVYRNSPTGDTNFVGSSTSSAETISITDTGVNPRSENKYYVYARNEIGWSAVSAESNVAFSSSIPSAPSSIIGPIQNPSLKVGRNVTINILRDSNGFGNSPTGYFLQFSTDNGSTWHGWNNTTKTRINNGENEVTGTSFTYQLLTPALTYRWRVYAKNIIGTGDLTRVTPVGVFVSAGGRRWTGSTWSPTESAKRWTGSAWVDITVAKRWSGTAWVDLT